MATPPWLNPNQPLPPVLASPLCPPPQLVDSSNMPLPIEMQPTPIWESLPVVQLDFPMGPYDDTTGCCNSDYSGPLGTGLWPGVSFCPGTSIGGVPPADGGTSGELPTIAPILSGVGEGARGIVRQERRLRREGERLDESLERRVGQRRYVQHEDREMARGRRARRAFRQGDLDAFREHERREERGDDRDRDDRERGDRD